MDTAEFFVKGLIVGFVVAAPVGPVAIMCIHRTISHGRPAGYVCGLGAASADTLFGAIAALGLGFLAADLLYHHGWLRTVGGIVLAALGLKLILARHLPPRAEKQELQEELQELKTPPVRRPRQLDLHFHLGSFATAFTVIITNPLTLISFAAIFATLDISNIHDYAAWGMSLVMGVFAGGVLWWTILIEISVLFRNRITANGILWVNRCSGLLILTFGVLLLFYPGRISNAFLAGLVPA